MHFVHGSETESISVVFITIWLWIMTWIIFWATGMCRRRVGLLYIRIRIRLHVVIRVRSVIRSICVSDNFWGILYYGYRSAPHFISCFFRSYCDFGWVRCYQIIAISIKDWLVIFTLPCCGVQIRVFKDNFRVWLPFTWCDWYMRYGLADLHWRSIIRWNTCIFLVPFFCSITCFQ